jgi:hypothetical protein
LMNRCVAQAVTRIKKTQTENLTKKGLRVVQKRKLPGIYPKGGS